MEPNPLVLPKIGLGTWDMRDEVCKNAIIKAIEIGYRFIDTATHYNNEQAVGDAIAENTIDRNELIIATKVWPTDYSPDKFKASVLESRKKLQVDTINIVYLHWPWSYAYKPKRTIPLLSELVDEGITKFVAVSNFSPKQVDEAQKLTRHKIVANQVENYPTRYQKVMEKYCSEHNLYLVGYSPLGQGKISKIGLLKDIADKYKITISQVALAWAIAHQIVPIPKASNEGHLVNNFAAVNVQLDEHDIQKIDALKK